MGMPGCHWCKVIAPKVAKLAKANPHVVFLKTEDTGVGSAFGARGFPTFKAFYDGSEVGTASGGGPATEEQLQSWVAKYAPAAPSGVDADAPPAPKSDTLVMLQTLG